MMLFIIVMVNPLPIGKSQVSSPLSTTHFPRTGWTVETLLLFPFYLGLPPTGEDQNYSLWEDPVAEGTGR